jgi:hypothetical protein
MLFAILSAGVGHTLETRRAGTKFHRRCLVDHLAILPDVEKLTRRKIQGRRKQGRRKLLDAGVVCLHCISVTEARARV